MRLPLTLLLCFSLLLLLITGCEQAPRITPNGKVVKIGVIGSFTGADSRIGNNGLLGVHTYLEAYPLLTSGEKLEAVIRDDKSTPAGALQALKELAALNVAAVLLLSDTSVALSLVPVADTVGLPIMATLATHPDITKDNSTLIQLCFDDLFQSTVAALFTRDELLVDNVAVFSNPASQYSTYLAKSFIKQFQEVGGMITQHVELGDTPIDLKATLEHLQFTQTELLYIPITPEAVIAIAEKAKEIGWSPQMLASDGLHSQFLLNKEAGREPIEGILTTDVYIKTRLLTRVGQKATETFKTLYKDPGTTFTALAFEGTAILAQSMQRCTDPNDAKCILNTLTNGTVFEGLIDNLVISKDGKTTRPVFINSIHNNQQVFKVKVY